MLLKPVASPLLERLVLKNDEAETGPAVTAGEWVKTRVAKNVNKAGGSEENRGEQEIIQGKKARYYD